MPARAWGFKSPLRHGVSPTHRPVQVSFANDCQQPGHIEGRWLRIAEWGEDVGGRTKMVMTHLGIPGDSPGAAGWAMALDKLATHVRQMTADQN